MKRFVLPVLLAAALPAADSHIVPAMNAFTTASYKQLTQGDANLIFSPFNIATALSMALAGARGQTAEEIQSVLHVHYDSTYDAALGTLLADLTKAGNTGGNELLTANGLWVQKGFAIQPAFESTLANNYQATPTPVDFIANSEAARSQINRLDRRAHQREDQGPVSGRLTRRRDPPCPHQRHLLLRQVAGPVRQLAHAARALHSGDRRHHSGQLHEPDLAFWLHRNAPAQILEMRYTGTGIAFDVLLPKTLSGLHILENSLTFENLTGWLGNLTSRNVTVTLPKFRAESEFSLRKALSTMGMPIAFTDKADFSGIDPKRGVAISEVVHKAFVDISEQGTEAAAATGIAIRPSAILMPEQAVVFRADHPFIFLIRDTRTGVVLFIGRLMNPR